MSISRRNIPGTDRPIPVLTCYQNYMRKKTKQIGGMYPDQFWLLNLRGFSLEEAKEHIHRAYPDASMDIFTFQ